MRLIGDKHALGKFEVIYGALDNHARYTIEMVGNFSFVVPDPFREGSEAVAFKDYKWILFKFEEATGLRVVDFQIISADNPPGLWYMLVTHRAPSTDDIIYENRWWAAL